MEIAKASGEMMSVGDAFITAILGYAIVFGGMILLILVIMLVSWSIRRMQKKKSEPAMDHPGPAVSVPAPLAPAPGTAGEIRLHNVSEKDAAMLMAITAHELGRPLNELRFISIREVDPK